MCMPTPDWNTIREKTVSELTELGCALWSKSDEKPLMLFPMEWYSDIPNGFEVESIFSQKVVMKHDAKPGEEGYVDDDYRGGYLAYGIRVSKG